MFKIINNNELVLNANKINNKIVLSLEFYKLKSNKLTKSNTSKFKINKSQKKQKLSINKYITEFINQNKYELKLSDFELLKYNRPLLLLKTKINYSIIKMNFKGNKSKPELVVLPGYSNKSICWTVSRINTYINTFPELVKNKFNAIYIINYENVKPIQDAKKEQRNELDKQITEHTYQIIKDLNITNLSLLGRSAGGGIALQLINMNGLNITACYLACAGGNINLFEDYLKNPNSNKNIKIVLGWSLNDKKIPFSKTGVNILETAKTYGFKKISKVLVNTTNDLEDFNHRIHPQMLFKL